MTNLFSQYPTLYHLTLALIVAVILGILWKTGVARNILTVIVTILTVVITLLLRAGLLIVCGLFFVGVFIFSCFMHVTFDRKNARWYDNWQWWKRRRAGKKNVRLTALDLLH